MHVFAKAPCHGDTSGATTSVTVGATAGATASVAAGATAGATASAAAGATASAAAGATAGATASAADAAVLTCAAACGSASACAAACASASAFAAASASAFAAASASAFAAASASAFAAASASAFAASQHLVLLFSITRAYGHNAFSCCSSWVARVLVELLEIRLLVQGRRRPSSVDLACAWPLSVFTDASGCAWTSCQCHTIALLVLFRSTRRGSSSVSQ